MAFWEIQIKLRFSFRNEFSRIIFLFTSIKLVEICEISGKQKNHLKPKSPKTFVVFLR